MAPMATSAATFRAMLRTYNEPFGVGSPDAEPLVLRAIDEHGAFVGGCVAATFWGWVVIDVLAVDERRRGRGLGSRIVYAVESEAQRRGCTRAHTSAWAFQGLSFWLARGYEVVGELPDHPEGHTLSWLRRDLLAAIS